MSASLDDDPRHGCTPFVHPVIANHLRWYVMATGPKAGIYRNWHICESEKGELTVEKFWSSQEALTHWRQLCLSLHLHASAEDFDSFEDPLGPNAVESRPGIPLPGNRSAGDVSAAREGGRHRLCQLGFLGIEVSVSPPSGASSEMENIVADYHLAGFLRPLFYPEFDNWISISVGDRYLLEISDAEYFLPVVLPVLLSLGDHHIDLPSLRVMLFFPKDIEFLVKPWPFTHIKFSVAAYDPNNHVLFVLPIAISLEMEDEWDPSIEYHVQGNTIEQRDLKAHDC
ncbi:hypothetical protein C8J56DRAFT_1038091 [Mycena floridula]|nr:hypothetical protein C8J56DRAFT_1038091 [Mycena floridula]